MAKFRLKSKKVGKITRPFRYDLNQIPYNYTVEVRNKFKGLNLIDRVPDELWMGDCTGDRDQDRPQEKEMQKSKMAVWGGLTNSCEKKRRQKERYKHLNAEFQRIAWRDKKAFFSDQCREIEENKRMGKSRDLFKKIRDTKGTYRAKMGTMKNRNVTEIQKQKVLRRGSTNAQKNYTKIDLHDSDNHDGVITHLEPHILE